MFLKLYWQNYSTSLNEKLKRKAKLLMALARNGLLCVKENALSILLYKAIECLVAAILHNIKL